MKNEKVAKGRIIGLAGPCFREQSTSFCGSTADSQDVTARSERTQNTTITTTTATTGVDAPIFSRQSPH